MQGIHSFRTEICDGVTIVFLAERIDPRHQRTIERDLALLMDQSSRLVLDLSGVQKLDSVGLGAIIGCLKRVRAQGGELKLCGPSKYARTLLELVRMHRVMDIFNTRQEAVESFTAQRWRAYVAA